MENKGRNLTGASKEYAPGAPLARLQEHQAVPRSTRPVSRTTRLSPGAPSRPQEHQARLQEHQAVPGAPGLSPGTLNLSPGIIQFLSLIPNPHPSLLQRSATSSNSSGLPLHTLPRYTARDAASRF